MPSHSIFFAVLLGGAVALLPMFAKDILHVGPWGLGVLRSAPAVGALLMSIALTRWPIQRNAGRSMFIAVAVFGVCMIVFGLSTVFIISFLALAVSGSADMVSVVVRQSLVQLDTPNEMRGRVSAVNSIFIGASNQLGEFESGATAALLGPWARWWSVEWGRCWWRRYGCAGFRRWRSGIGCRSEFIEDARQTAAQTANRNSTRVSESATVR